MSPFEPSSSDACLLARMARGEPQGFEELVSRYRGPLLRAARSRLGRDDWAEDAVQETMLCVVRWLHTYDSRYSFRTWLWTILLNQCSRLRRRMDRAPEVGNGQESDLQRNALDQHGATPAALTPAHLVAAQERSELLDQLLARLPEVQADSLRLRFYGGLKFSEIAQAMDCSLSSAKARVKQGLQKLAEMLGPQGEFSRWTEALGDAADD